VCEWGRGNGGVKDFCFSTYPLYGKWRRGGGKILSDEMGVRWRDVIVSEPFEGLVNKSKKQYLKFVNVLIILVCIYVQRRHLWRIQFYVQRNTMPRG
jgi:hypothetical protein